jgi:hypothetical protein
MEEISSAGLERQSLIELRKALEIHKTAVSQEELWNRSKWIEALPASFTPLLQRIGPTVSRNDLYESAKNEPLVNAFIICMVWGFGRDERGPRKVTQIINNAGTSIESSLEKIREHSIESPDSGFRSLYINEKTRITGLGTSFGTKVLHMFGHKEIGLEPLVYDNHVYSTLLKFSKFETLGFTPFEPTEAKSRNNPECYEKYCEWAFSTAEVLSTTKTIKIFSRDVEFLLFSIDKSRRRSRTKRN